MARINIEEKWKTDPRRKALSRLLKSDREADGMLVEVAWLVLAHKGEGIPLSEFKFLDNFDDWMACGLGEIDGEWVRIAGSEQYRLFFEKQRKNSALGGEAMKAKASEGSPDKPTGSPKKPKPSPKSPSSSSSSSKEEEEENTASIRKVSFETKESLLAAVPQKTKDLWARLYNSDFVERNLALAWDYYSHKPPKNLAGWSRALSGWLERTTRWEQQAVKKENRPGSSEFTGGWEYTDGVS